MLSSKGPHRLASRWLSDGSKLISKVMILLLKFASQYVNKRPIVTGRLLTVYTRLRSKCSNPKLILAASLRFHF